MKILWGLFLALPMLLLGSAESHTVKVLKKQLLPGEPLEIEIIRQLEENTLRAWQVYAFAPTVPAGLDTVPEVFRRDAIRSQDVCYIFGGVQNAVWLPRTEWNATRMIIKLETAGWPHGDYRLGVNLTTMTPDAQQLQIKTTIDLNISPRKLSTLELLAEKPWYEGFHPLYKGIPLTAGTRFKIGSDAEAIHVLIEAAEPDTSKLVAKHSSGTPLLWRDDSVEFAITADPASQTQYKWIINSKAHSCEFFQQDDNTGTGNLAVVRGWRGFADIAVNMKPDHYLVSLRIPFGALEPGKDPKWKFNVARSRYTVKPAEYASYSKLGGELFDRPWEYTPVEFAAFDPANLALTVENISQPDSDGSVSIQADLINRSSTHRIISLTGSLLAQNQQISAPPVTLSVPAGKYTRFVMLFPADSPEGNYTLEFQLRSTDSSLIRAVRHKITIDNHNLLLKIFEPSYRNAIFATMPDKRIRATATFRKTAPEQQIEYQLSGPGNNSLTHRAKAGIPVEFDLAEWPDGDYQLLARSGNETDTAVIRKLPPSQEEVRIDNEGVTIVNGKRFLPCGWFRSSPNERLAGNTSFMTYSRFNTPDELQRCFDQFAASTGTLGLMFPFQEFSGHFEYRHFNSKQLMGKLTEEQKKVLDNLVRIAGNSRVLGWYLADEPEMRNENSAWYAECREYLTKIDPYHPTLMLNCSISGIRDYQDCADILFPDYYPDYFENGPRIPLNGTASFIREAAKYKPAWGVIQAFVWMPEQRGGGVPGRPPTFAEIRNQFYQVFAANGKGVLLYDFYHASQMFSVTRLAPDWLFAEGNRLKEFLLDPNVNDAVKVITEPENQLFEVALKKGTEDRFCLIAINTSNQNVKMTFSGQLPEVKLFVASENRSVEVNNGSFSDEFPPYATHIYINSSAAAQDLETLAQASQRIADFDAERTVPGNLAAFGVPRLLDFVNAHKEVFPAGKPQIRATSETARYFTRNWATALNLLDGIKESYPRDGHMTWQPNSADKKPVLTLTLPKAGLLCKLKLYRIKGWKLYGGRDEVSGLALPGGIVRACAEDGKWQTIAEFANSDRDVLTIPLTPGMFQELRIEFTGNQFALSELEVF